MTVQSWAVTVSVNGEDVLTISSSHLSGIENIADYADGDVARLRADLENGREFYCGRFHERVTLTCGQQSREG